MTRLRRLSISTAVLFSSALQAAQPNTYIVKNGDTLSSIAKDQVGKPIYSRDGTLAKLIQWNPQLENPHSIQVGDSIHIRAPDSERFVPIRQVAAEPSTAPAVETVTPARVGHGLVWTTRYAITTLSGDDPATAARAEINSSYDIETFLGWKQDWSRSFSTVFLGSVRAIDLQPSTNSRKTLTNTAKLAPGLAIGAEQKLGEEVLFDFGARYRNELVLRGLNASTISLDTVPVPSAYVGLKYSIFERDHTTLSIAGSFENYFSASSENLSIANGTAYQAQFSVGRRNEAKSTTHAEISIGYRDRAQDTSVLKMHESAVFGTLQLQWPLFEGQ